MSAHKARGSHDSSVLRVNSGVAFVGTQPRREHTLLTFVSTIKPSSPLHPISDQSVLVHERLQIPLSQTKTHISPDPKQNKARQQTKPGPDP